MSDVSDKLPHLIAVAAMSNNRVIGTNGALPWHFPPGHVPRGAAEGRAEMGSRVDWDGACALECSSREHLALLRGLDGLR